MRGRNRVQIRRRLAWQVFVTQQTSRGEGYRLPSAERPIADGRKGQASVGRPSIPSLHKESDAEVRARRALGIPAIHGRSPVG